MAVDLLSLPSQPDTEKPVAKTDNLTIDLSSLPSQPKPEETTKPAGVMGVIKDFFSPVAVNVKESNLSRWASEGFPLEMSDGPDKEKTVIRAKGINNIIKRYNKYKDKPAEDQLGGKYFNEEIPLYADVTTTRAEQDAQVLAGVLLIGTMGWSAVKDVINRANTGGGQAWLNQFGYKLKPAQVKEIYRKATATGWEALTPKERQIWQNINDSGLFKEGIQKGVKVPFFGGKSMPIQSAPSKPFNAPARTGRELVPYGQARNPISNKPVTIIKTPSVVKPTAPVAKPVVKPTQSPLAQEAKKYKTAEEFVESQPVVYHGTNAEFEKFSLSTFGRTDEGFAGIGNYFTSDISYAKGYGKNLKEVYLDLKNPYIYDDAMLLGSVNPDVFRESLGLSPNASARKVRETLLSKGYDGVVINEVDASGKIVTPNIEVMAMGNMQIKTKQQLTDIWNKAQEKPTPKTISERATAKVKELKDKREQSQLLKETRTELKGMAREMKGRIMPHEDGQLAEEYSAIPSYFKTKKDGITMDEAASELGIAASEVPAYLTDLKTGIDDFTKQIDTLKEKVTKKAELPLAKERLRAINQGIREGSIATAQEIKTAQTELVNLLQKQTNLTPADRAKFMTTVKNIDSAAALAKAIPEIAQRVAQLETKAEINILDTKIKKELKSTKPLKQGTKLVGKFDYDSNTLFDEMRNFGKLNKTKAQAELDNYPDELNSEFDLIKKRFLSLKANGKSASQELYEKVLEDITKIKELGRAVKDEADLMKLINRQDLVDEMVLALDKIKGDKITFGTKLLNGYRKGFSNIYSMLNSMSGKDLATRYNPELSENARDTATYDKTKLVTEVSQKILGVPKITEAFKEMTTADYQITDMDGLETTIGKLELIDIYNSIKNPAVKQRYFDTYGEEQVKSLLNNLSAKELAFADYLQEVVQEYRPILNERNIEITGRDLGTVENYWPATSEHTPSVFDDVRMQGETPSALKARAKGKVIPVPKNAWYKAQKHIAVGEHVEKLSRTYEDLMRLFKDRKVKHGITQKYGQGVYDTLMGQIDTISLNRQAARIDAITSIFGKAVNNWVAAKVALNPSTYIRQLMSVGNYMENMKAAEWTTGYFEGITSPKKTFDYMWKNSPFLEARFNRGYSEALTNAIEGAKKMGSGWESYTKVLTSMVRSGDVTAIVYGGYPYVKAQIASGVPEKVAFANFEQATLRSQQSGLSSSLSQFQNSGNAFARLFLAFKNTSHQYMRKMVDPVISFANGDTSAKDASKSLFIYGVIQPILYVLGGMAVKEGAKFAGDKITGRKPKEEDPLTERMFDEMLTQIVVNPVNAIPIVDDIAKTAMRKATGKNVYKIFNTPLFDQLETAGRLAMKKEPTAYDYITIAGSVLEPVTKAPILTGSRYYKYLFKGDEKEFKDMTTAEKNAYRADKRKKKMKEVDKARREMKKQRSK